MCVTRIHIRSTVYQYKDNVWILPADCLMQGSISKPVTRIHIRALSQQKPSNCSGFAYIMQKLRFPQKKAPNPNHMLANRYN